jgi:hypothetical protein
MEGTVAGCQALQRRERLGVDCSTSDKLSGLLPGRMS